MPLANFKPATRTLCTLPPECLLSIIAHLSPSTYTSLVHTSHYFQQFFSTHAATICNAYILTYYHLSASYLDSRYVNGWLVPSHPAVAVQEKQLLCPPALHIFTFQLKGRMLLSSPGPQYLFFLAQYDFDIRTRRSMTDRELAGVGVGDNTPLKDNDEKKVELKEVVDEEEEDDGDENSEGKLSREEVEERFTYMVGTYAVRPFLRRLDDFAASLEERRIEEARRRFDYALDGISRRPVGSKARISVRSAGTKLSGLKRRVELALKGFAKKMGKEKRELCFGEIESDEETEKGGCESPMRNGMEGLLWFYGAMAVLDFRERETRRGVGVEKKVEGKVYDTEEANKTEVPKEKRVERVKVRVQKALGRVAKVNTCFGTERHFESLD